MHTNRLIITGALATGISLPAVAHAGEDNIVRIYSVTNANVVTEVDEEDLSDSHPAGWSFVRPYVAGGSHYVFALKRQTGEAQIFNAVAGDMGTPVAGAYDLTTDWTSATIYYNGGAAFLVLHRSRDGMVWRYALNGNGTLGTKTTYGSLAAWRDKSDFVPYMHGGGVRFSATDRWTGRAAFHDVAGVAVGSDTWTQGWTSADYIDTAGTTWRVLYKPLDTPGDQHGRLVVQEVAADGSSQTTLSDDTIAGWTHVKFVRTPLPGGSTRLFFYDAATGNWVLRAFSAVTGLGSPVALGTEEGGTNLAPDMVDLSVYAPGSTAYVYGLQEDGNRVLSSTELDTLAGGPDGPDVDGADYGIASSVYQAYRADSNGDSPGGWELAFFQSGRLVLRTDGGTSNYHEDIAMDGTRHRWNWGSGSKAFTGITAMKLADRGEIDLDAPLEVYLDPEVYASIHADNRYITVRELIGYRAGWDGEPSCADNCENNWVCTAKLAQARTCDSCVVVGGRKSCGLEYANSNFLVVRNVVEWTMGRQLPEDAAADDAFVEGDFVDYMKWLWWDRAGIGDTRCTPDPVTHGDLREDSEQLYYSLFECTEDYGPGECTDVAGMTLDWNESIYKAPDPGDAAACGQGGVQATAESTARMLASLRYERVLSPDATAYTLQAVEGGERAGFYGNTLDTTVSPSKLFTGKNGGNDGICEALMHRWSLGVDSALVTNESGDVHSTSAVLKGAWLGRTIP